jgi:hypothetical protein
MHDYCVKQRIGQLIGFAVDVTRRPPMFTFSGLSKMLPAKTQNKFSEQRQTVANGGGGGFGPNPSKAYSKRTAKTGNEQFNLHPSHNGRVQEHGMLTIKPIRLTKSKELHDNTKD